MPAYAGEPDLELFEIEVDDELRIQLRPYEVLWPLRVADGTAISKSFWIRGGMQDENTFVFLTIGLYSGYGTNQGATAGVMVLNDNDRVATWVGADPYLPSPFIDSAPPM